MNADLHDADPAEPRPAPRPRLDYARLDRQAVAAAVWTPTCSAPRSDYDLDPRAPPPRRPDERMRPAAVLCGLVERADGLAVILTRRAAHLARHAGQIAFPGGKVDAADPSPLAAALREAREEIGLTADAVEVLGAIDPYQTATGFAVTPFVGFVKPTFAPIPDPGEVAEVFEAPFGFLMDPANHQRLSRDTPLGRRRFYAMPYADKFIWGATAGMLKSLSDRLHDALAR